MDFADCPSLEELYLRNNSVSDISELAHLKGLTRLRVLWLEGNPCTKHPAYRTLLLQMLPKLHRLDNIGCILISIHFITTTRSSATAETARDAWNGHSGSLKVIRCCANRRGIYGFLLPLNVNFNLASIFNRSWDIMPSLHIHTPPLFQMELKKDSWE